MGNIRSSPSELFTGKGVLKICSKYTGEHPCQSAISMKLQSNFFEIALLHGCSTVNLLHILRAPFPKNTSEGLLLRYVQNFRLVYGYLNEGNKVCECYGCLKLVTQAYLHSFFFTIFFIKYV